MADLGAKDPPGELTVVESTRAAIAALVLFRGEDQAGSAVSFTAVSVALVISRRLMNFQSASSM